MRVDCFDFELPEDQIASRPPPERDGARMLVLDAGGRRDSRVVELPDFIEPGSLLVVNNTRVLHARLLGVRRGTGGKCEILLLQPLDGSISGARWSALGRASKALRPGSVLEFGEQRELVAEVVGSSQDGVLEVSLSSPAGLSISDAIEKVGHVPLPPYVQRPDDESDRERYQTVFASRPGAVAAPTAGLHLSHALIERLKSKNVVIAPITLHVGLGTFRPVSVDDLDDHPMHEEWLEVSSETAEQVAQARARGAKVVAVGTTSVRALESSADADRVGFVKAWSGTTRLLIQPGYSFRVVDSLLTNFHLPKSTLMALVAAFGGLTPVLDAYRHAVKSGYKFFSFGDAMFMPSRVAPEQAST
ncbi:MAG: tRNA preQ1(34) S-adenosylmethionine ribosyltransferase-isomerase QueA [Polyangiaceae bacterium]